MSAVQAVAATATRMKKTVALGADFWNDSCSVQEPSEAVANGATGATSNPVIVFSVVKSDTGTWLPVVDELVRCVAFRARPRALSRLDALLRGDQAWQQVWPQRGIRDQRLLQPLAGAARIPARGSELCSSSEEVRTGIKTGIGYGKFS